MDNWQIISPNIYNTYKTIKSVIVLGRGVAGMSAAHELIERGFEVEVCERHGKYPGEKARSVDVTFPRLQNSKPLPGEHGFWFPPGFYTHIIDTMKRIPFKKADGSDIPPMGEPSMQNQGQVKQYF